MTQEIRYYTFPDFLRKLFPCKVQKISINAGFTCPNRDGTKGWGGCTYCNNQTFSPDYCHTEKPVAEQLNEGVRFFSHKYPEMKYFAYFQAYTNTYGEIEVLKQKYEEALAYPGVVGLIIGTRPDCMPDELLDYLTRLAQSTFILIEYGVESTLNSTLSRINRGHSWEQAREAILRTCEASGLAEKSREFCPENRELCPESRGLCPEGRGLFVGAHIILGLPGENREDILRHADVLSELPLTTLKLHQLQLIRHTRMAKEFEEDPGSFHLYTDVDEYVELVVDFIERVDPSIVMERFVSQSPKELLIAPDWGLKNYEFTAKVNKRLQERNTWQGRLKGGHSLTALGEKWRLP